MTGGSLLLATALKLWLVLTDAVPFNGDEAVVALMARHINQGARPFFFYGQAYMGSLDAWLIAIGFRLFGEGVFAIRLVQISLYVLYLITLGLMSWRIFRDKRIALLAMWIAAVPTTLVTTYTTASLGGYGEILVFGNLILWLGYEVIYGEFKDRWVAWLGLGLVGGVAFWTLGLAGVYLMPVAILGLVNFRYQRIPYYLLAAVAFFLASGPWWISNLTSSGEPLAVLTGQSALSLYPTTTTQRLTGFLVLGIPTLLGIRPPWTPDLAPWYVSVPLLVVTFGAFLYLARRVKAANFEPKPGLVGFFSWFTISFTGIFILTHFGIDATGRYFLPIYLVLVLILAYFISAAWTYRKVFGLGLVLILLGLNGFETWRAASSIDKLTTQFDPISRFDNQYDEELMTFLWENGERRGYTNYWVSFRLAFLSAENQIFVAKLPYKADMSYSPADNRYAGYEEDVNQSAQVAYITSKHPALDDRIREGLQVQGVSHLENQIGDYHVFYQLSRRVEPEELGLGVVPR